MKGTSNVWHIWDFRHVHKVHIGILRPSPKHDGRLRVDPRPNLLDVKNTSERFFVKLTTRRGYDVSIVPLHLSSEVAVCSIPNVFSDEEQWNAIEPRDRKDPARVRFHVFKCSNLVLEHIIY